MSKFKYLNIETFKDKRGISTLPMMLLLGGIIIEIAVTITFLAYYFNISNSSARLSTEALTTARTGLDDGIIKVVRDKNFSGDYAVAVGRGTANVSICKDTCVIGKTEITSTVLGISQRKLRAVLAIDASTGKVVVESIEEI